MVLAILLGLGYIAWLVWAEGWRLWMVIGVMSLVGLVGGAAHFAMGLARQREGLDASDTDGASNREDGA